MPETLSEEETIKNNKKLWGKLKRGQIIEYYTHTTEGIPHFALTVEQKENEWKIIEFSKDNRERLIKREKAEFSYLELDNIFCLSILTIMDEE